MIIKKADFIKSAVKLEAYPETQEKDFAFIGRSNVGKSSLINLILNRKIAKTSKTPGRTQLVNFFLINDIFYFVDLPGYGFAKVPKYIKKEWGTIIETYLKSDRGKTVFLLLDIRRTPNEDDLLMLNWLKHYEIDHKIIITKADKLSNNEKFKQIKIIEQNTMVDKKNFFITSVLKRTGMKEILENID